VQLDAVHGLQNFLSLDLDPNGQLVALSRQPLAELLKGNGRAGEVRHHDHREEFTDHGLADVQDIDIGLGEHVRDLENSVFDALDAVIDGQNPKPPFNLGYSVATRPDRLAPRAEGMTRRFVILVSGDIRTVPNGREQIEALAVAIGALPHEAFLSVAGSLFDVVKEDPDRVRHKYPMIYIRMGKPVR